LHEARTASGYRHPACFSLFQFVLSNVKPLPFRTCEGEMQFFDVDEEGLDLGA